MISPERAPALTEAVVASLPELEQFMDWARPERTSVEEFADFISRSLHEWESGESHNFHVIETATDELVGNCGLMRRVGPGAIEIGYWIRSDRAGRGYATEAARALVGAAWMLPDVERVEIRFDAANGASAAVAAKTGAVEIERRDVEIDNPGEIGVEVITELAIPPRRPLETSPHRLPESLPGERVRLERTTVDQLEVHAVAVAESLPELRAHLHWARYDPVDLDGFLAEVAKRWDDGSLNSFHVFDRESGALIGGCGLERSVGPGAVEVSYWTHTAWAGRGIATEVLGMMVDAAWTLPDVDRVVLIHDVVNVASARVADKHGFVEFDRTSIPILGFADSGTVIWRQLLRPAGV